MKFYKGKLYGKDAVVVQSGIGKVNAAICTQILADCYHVDEVINTGVAGSLDAEINIGDIVISTDAVHHDMDVSALGDPVGQVPRMDVFAFPADKELAEKAMQANKRQIRRSAPLWEELRVVISLFPKGSKRSDC